LRGVAQLIHTRAEEGGVGAADGKKNKMKKSKDSVQRAIKITENASRNHAHMILDMRVVNEAICFGVDVLHVL
jgi:hypothetical protein